MGVCISESHWMKMEMKVGELRLEFEKVEIRGFIVHSIVLLCQFYS
jgi:hypothetical protein